MSPVEFIGFLISFLALIFLFFKNKREMKANAERHEEMEEDDPLKEFLKTLDHQEEVHAPPPPEKRYIPPPAEPRRRPPSNGSFSSLDTHRLETNVEKRKLATNIEARKLKTSIENRSIGLGIRNRSILLDKSLRAEEARAIPKESRSAGQLGHLASLRQMVIYHEIWDKPKGL